MQLLGALDADGVREQLAWADVLIHPSLTEAFGVAVAEAQAMGLPVVCSDAGGLPENIDHGVTGFAVPRRDAAAMADADRAAGRSRASPADGQAARRRAEQELDHRVQLDRFEAVYRELLEQPAATSEHELPLREARARHRREQMAALRERLAAGGEQPNCGSSCGGARWSSWCRATSNPSFPAGARVLVVSRGDEDIVDFARHRGEHFPQAADGRYAGHHPADSDEAIAHLASLHEAGADFLVIPGTAQWWLDHYDGFARHLDQRHRRMALLERGYIAYALEAPAGERAA